MFELNQAFTRRAPRPGPARHFARTRAAAVAISVVLAAFAAPAGAEDCSLVEPWINEIDYDSNDVQLIDREEFVEIAAPVGADLGGYEIVSVEGNGNLLSLCLTGAPFVATGEAHFQATLPPGTIAGKHNGTGVGFVVVCFQGTSGDLVTAGVCDVVLAGDSMDSNLRDGDLQDLDPVACPDGVLLSNEDQSYTDALSWEGLVPFSGTWGPYFGLIDIGLDPGSATASSLSKTTSNAGATAVSSEWAPSGSTPGASNPGQAIVCDAVCGNGYVEPGEACDDGNLTDEDGCSSLCEAETCGDGVLQPGLGEDCDDGNVASEDGCSAACLAEWCGDGVVQPGLGEACDDGNDDDFDVCRNDCQPYPAPTLDGWGLLGLVLLLTTAGSALLRRSRRPGADHGAA